MSLNYKGPEKELVRKRDLEAIDFNAERLRDFVEKEKLEAGPDKIFDDLASTYLKGEALKEAIGNMNPAAFIPVEPGASVIASIQRLAPDMESYDVITFGLFKDACDHISGRYTSFDEDFILNFNHIDPNLASTTIKKQHKNIKLSGADWITEFLVSASAYAGMMIGGYVSDIFGSSIERFTAESDSSGNEPKLWSLQGLAAGVALMVELGVTYVLIKQSFEAMPTLNKDVESTFIEMQNDPQKRREALEEAGYDYDSLRANQKYDDYKAVKEYSLQYIAANPKALQYDHWSGYLQTASMQTTVKYALSFAPQFSLKWKKFLVPDATEGLEEGTVSSESSELKPINVSVSGFISLASNRANDSYNELYNAYTFTVDTLALCCVLFFIGPINTDRLKTMVKIMDAADITLSFGVEGLRMNAENFSVVVLSLVASYINKLADKQLKDLAYNLVFVREDILSELIEICPFLEGFIRIFDYAIAYIFDLLNRALDSINDYLLKDGEAILVNSRTTVERRYSMTLSEMVKSVLKKIDLAKTAIAIDAFIDVCDLEAQADNPNISVEIAAEAAVTFVATELPDLFPILEMPEVSRRKHFSNLSGYTTDKIKVEVGGTDGDGIPQMPKSFEERVHECGKESTLIKNATLGKLFAQAVNND
jgi:hypothetical protein